MFLRGYGSQSHTKNNGSTIGNTATTHASGNLGQIQGDAARRHHGYFDAGYGEPGTNVGVLRNPSGILADSTDVSAQFVPMAGPLSTKVAAAKITMRIMLDSGRTLPVDSENRPANVAVRHIIRVR